MFIAIIGSILILTTIQITPLQPENKVNKEDVENFEITSFVFGDDSIRLNISWENNLSEDTILDILVENNGDRCYYVNEFFCYSNVLQNNIVIIPSLNISEPVDSILLGCSYNITVMHDLETHIYLYQVPDCIGNYCACVTNETNFLQLLAVEHVQGDRYSVRYTSQNTSLEEGNFYITDIFYIDTNESNTFQIPKVKYQKGKFEIRMEYLNDGQNYTLYVTYKDADNANPDCYYTANLRFEAVVPSDVIDDYIIMKVALSVSLFLSVSTILFCLLRQPKYYMMIVEEMKKCIFPNDVLPKVENLSISSLKCPHQEVNMLYTPLELTAHSKIDAYEFPRDNIIIKDVIGEGAFGKVYYAKAYNLNGLPGYTMVAVKQLRGDAPKEEMADFQAEIRMLKKIGVHKNIVKLLACVTTSQPYMMIMELVSTGDLKEYLLRLREIWIKNKGNRRFFPDDVEEKSIKPREPNKDTLVKTKDDSNENPNLPPRSLRTPDFISKLLLSEGITTFDDDIQTPLLSDMGGRPDPVLDHKELENFALQIATGMAYLEKIPVTHRDLAARNILITKEKVLKISDFGMSRTGPYINRSLKKVPLRWMAIEAIEDFKTDNKSDVWSFGVVLWEIGTLGAFPYENIPNELLPKELKAGRRLSRPEICSDELYDLMQKCWLENPQLRPSFGELVDHLNLKKKHVYVDFTQINPKYVFPPTDEAYGSVVE